MSDPYNPQPGAFPAPGQPAGGPGGFNPPGFNPPGPPAPPTAPPTSSSGFGYGAEPTTPLVGQDPPSQRSRGKMIGAVAGVAALLAAGTFAFTQLRSNDSEGGAANPEELGTDLVAALDNEDILGAVDLLLPGERETFRQPLLDFVSELKRLEITDDSADLGNVGGFDISLTDPDVEVRETNVDDISLVRVAADSSVTVNGDDLPIGDFLIETVFGGDRPEVEDSTEEQDFDVTFATVQQDGRWYISLFYSAANSISGGADIPDEGITAVGADSPDGALDNLVKYTSNLDIENIIASLNPNEASALQRYGPLFIDDAQDALDEVDVTWEISDATYTVEGSGDTRQVAIDGFHFEAQVDGETVEFDWADGCLIGSTPEGEFDSCTAFDAGQDGATEGYLEQLGLEDNEAVSTLVGDLGDAFADFSLHGVVVDRVDGAWFVSPIGTGSEAFLSVLRALDRDEIETLIDDVGTVFDSGFDMPEIDVPTTDTVPDPFPTDDTVTDDTFPTDDTVTDDTFPTDDTVTDDTFPTDDTVTDDTASDISWYDCLDESTVSTEISACIQAGIAAGDFEPDFIPAPLLYAECNLFDYYLSDELFTDDAATFLATIEPGRQCIVDAAAAQGLDLLYSSAEFLYPDCFAMDNPYNYDEPDEVSGYDCAFQAGD